MAYRKTPSYLWQHASGMWFLKRPIRPELRRHYINEATGKPRSHVIQSLGTHSRVEAEQLKRAPLRLIEAAFVRLSSGVMSRETSGQQERLKGLRHAMSTAVALDGARVTTEDDQWDDPHGVLILQELAAEAAESMALEHGREAASLAYKLATQPDKLSLREALAERHKGATTREQTKAAEVKALDDLLSFLHVSDCLPEAVTDKRATAYVDSLDGSKLAHATKKGRLSCLGRLWSMRKVAAQLPRGAVNPWRGHDVKGQKRSTAEAVREAGRNWTADEMVKVFAATDEHDKRRRTYTRTLFRELHAVGFITGMRLDEITSLRRIDLTVMSDGVVVNVRKAKTDAGVRSIPVTHPVAVSILTARAKTQAEPTGLLFAECVPGGPDNKTSWHVSKAMGKDRDRLSLNEVTFHSTRGTFMNLQENAGTNVVHVQRYVGHVIETVMHKSYTKGSTVETLMTIATAVKYPDVVEAQLAKLIRHAL